MKIGQQDHPALWPDWHQPTFLNTVGYRLDVIAAGWYFESKSSKKDQGTCAEYLISGKDITYRQCYQWFPVAAWDCQALKIIPGFYHICMLTAERTIMNESTLGLQRSVLPAPPRQHELFYVNRRCHVSFDHHSFAIAWTICLGCHMVTIFITNNQKNSVTKQICLIYGGGYVYQFLTIFFVRQC